MEQKGYDRKLLKHVSDQLFVEQLSWRQLSLQTGVPERTLQNWRDDRTHIRYGQAAVMCRHLRLSLDPPVYGTPMAPDPETERIVRLVRFLSPPQRLALMAFVAAIVDSAPTRI